MTYLSVSLLLYLCVSFFYSVVMFSCQLVVLNLYTKRKLKEMEIHMDYSATWKEEALPSLLKKTGIIELLVSVYLLSIHRF